MRDLLATAFEGVAFLLTLGVFTIAVCLSSRWLDRREPARQFVQPSHVRVLERTIYDQDSVADQASAWLREQVEA